MSVSVYVSEMFMFDKNKLIKNTRYFSSFPVYDVFIALKIIPFVLYLSFIISHFVCMYVSVFFVGFLFLLVSEKGCG